MKEDLKSIFSNVNEQLRFGEAKHAGIIAFNSALIIGAGTAYVTNPTLFDKSILAIAIICIGLSIAGSIFAQFPVTSNLLFGEKEISDPNIYYFVDLARLSVHNFEKELKKTYPNQTLTPIELDLINQILVNSRIAATKFSVFKFCSWMTLLGTGILGVSTIIRLWA